MTTLKTCEQLLNEYKSKKNNFFDKEKLIFDGVGEKDVYNISAPFIDENEMVIAE